MKGWLNSPDTIKQYLTSQFDTRKPKKPTRFYQGVASLYNTDPVLVHSIIDSVPKWGYPKDYFYLLLASRSQEMTAYIYDVIHATLMNDIKLKNEGKRISTLVKWMPRENLAFAKKIPTLIDTLAQRLYPGPKFTSRKKYRHFITDMSRYLDVTEIKLCAKTPETINFAHVPKLCLENNLRTIKSSPEAAANLSDYHYKKYKNVSLATLVNLYMTNAGVDVVVLDRIYTENLPRYKAQLERTLDCSYTNFTSVLLDLSREMFDSRYISSAIAVGVLTINQQLYVNSAVPERIMPPRSLRFDVIIDEIKENMRCYPKIITTNLPRPLLVVTNKPTLTPCADILHWQLADRCISHYPGRIIGYKPARPVKNKYLTQLTTVLEQHYPTPPPRNFKTMMNLCISMPMLIIILSNILISICPERVAYKFIAALICTYVSILSVTIVLS